ncbi:MAG: hypothetical protein A4E28_01619 [Methanocella sp. PtaU1.Bin125]|nr:MAG: hypothetical protein A4E28_01619 [Methanocella sp. PtaU1.Bin125]
MRLLAVVFIAMATVMACGCMDSMNDGAGAPTPGAMPTAEPVPAAPTAPSYPTAEPLPTYRPVQNITPVPPDANDPIIGTWRWSDANNNVSIYQFNADGTFQRRDEDRNMTVYLGVWERKGPDTYFLIYNTPTPGVSIETITYHPAASRMARGPDVYTRV